MPRSSWQQTGKYGSPFHTVKSLKKTVTGETSIVI